MWEIRGTPVSRAARAPALHELRARTPRPDGRRSRSSPPRRGSRCPHPFGDLLYIDGGDVLDRQVPERVSDALGLEVGAGRADDPAGRSSATARRGTRRRGRDPSGTGRRTCRRRDPRAPASDRPPRAIASARTKRGASASSLPARKPDQHVLVNERATEVRGRHADRSRSGRRERSVVMKRRADAPPSRRSKRDPTEQARRGAGRRQKAASDRDAPCEAPKILVPRDLDRRRAIRR